VPAVDSIREANPYKGPYAFTLKDAALFTGRDEEAETLLSLAISERIVVFCAPSGAGKSSLLNARLIPGLRRRGFKVLPVVRVGGDLPSLPQTLEPANVFAFNALWILAGSKADPAVLKDCTLDSFLKPISRGRGRKGPPRVLIFDQFEEILTTHPDRWPQRKDFFLQLRQALLDDPTLSVVLSLREDHLAGFDTYAPLLPGQLRTRFRMETLRRDKAVAAARKPALAAGRPFDPEVAERLVEDLSRVRMAGHEEPVPGELVEPVQLQVVCYQLWENLKDKPGKTITEDDRRKFGDPDQALEGFYESAARQASEKTGIPESQIRHWCGTALITPTRIRGQVNREDKASGGLPNPAIDSLVDAHLVRAEAARGGIWYELAHDRFVEPILRSNQRAAPSQATRLAEDARAWLKAGRDPSFLYGGLRLEEAVRSSSQDGVLLSPQESEFLAHSQKAEADAQVRRTRRLWFAVAVMAVLVLASAFSAYVAWQQNRLSSARELALAATSQAEEDPELGLLLALEAVKKAPILETEAALHEALQASVVRRALSIPIASNSASAFAFSPDGKQVAAVNENGFVGIWDAASGEPVNVSPRPAATVTSLAWSPSGLVAYGDNEGNVVFWNPGSASPVPPPLALGAGVISLVWNFDGSRLAIGGDDSSEVRLWNASTRTLETLRGGPGTAVLAVAFSPDGRYLAFAPEGEENGVVVQDLQSRARVLLRHPLPVMSLAFSPDGNTLATGCRDAGLRLWDRRTGQLSRTFLGHWGWISGVAFSPDGKYLGTSSFDGEARLWSLSSRESLYVLSPEGGQLSRIAFSPVAGKMADVSQAVMPEATHPIGTLTLWDIVLDDKLLLPVQANHLAGFTSDSRSLVAVDGQSRALRWYFSSERPRLDPLLDSRGPIGYARVALQDRLVALGRREILRRFMSRPGPVSRTPIPKDLYIGSFAASGDGRRLAAFHWKTVYLLELDGASGNPKIVRLPQEVPVAALALSPDGARLAIAGDDGSLQVKPLGQAEIDSAPLRDGGYRVPRVYGLAFSPDGRWLASAEDDRTAKLWNVEKATVQQVFEGHTGRVIAVAFSPDGQRLASADEEGEVRLWEIAEGRDIFNLQGHASAVTELAFSPDGKWLAALGADGTVRLDPMALDDLSRMARARVSRQLTPRERRVYLHSD
jgi:WD40 repeat protein